MKELSSTKEKIYIAFATLFKTKELTKIKVSEISRIARINRSTFYEYFKDIYDLLDDFENFLVDVLKSSIKADFTYYGVNIVFKDLTYIPNEKYARHISLLFGSYNSHLRLKTIIALSKYLEETLDLNGDDIVIDCATTSFIAGVIGYLGNWSRLYPGLYSAPDKERLSSSLVIIINSSLNDLIKLDRKLKAENS
ncbi:MAG: TetR/AcrR family transcriptional regulator [Saccharofermentans sp.]|nr:TetR/AcrR family transcriptional regulator [Saccharofermentans sp.]